MITKQAKSRSVHRRTGPARIELVDSDHKQWPQVLRVLNQHGQRNSLCIGDDGWLSARQSVLVAFIDEKVAGHLAFSVQLVRGDYSLAAAGTVTMRDGDRIYAFGHPLLSLGASDMPMAESSVVTVISNMSNSFKLSVPGRMVGAISQDRASGIFGLLRKAPKMIPVKVNLHTSRDRMETYNYEIATDSFLTPLLLNITLFNTITSSERALGDSTISVKGEIRVKGQETIQIDRRFSANNSPILASSSIAAPVSSLLASGFDDVQLDEFIFACFRVFNGGQSTRVLFTHIFNVAQPVIN